MPRNLLKKWLPSPKKIRDMPGLGFLGALLHDPNLFHLNRHSVSVALFVGLFIGFLPIPGIQTVIVAIAALIFRCNLPFSIALIWVSNPLTMPLMYWAELELGNWLLGTGSENYGFDLSWQWFTTTFPKIWKPLLLGSVVSGLFFGGAGYFITHWVWRWHVLERWQARKHRKKKGHT